MSLGKGTKERKNLNISKINRQSRINLPSLILKSEKYYSDQIKEIIDQITHPNSEIKLLLISGPSSSGKTTTANIINLELRMKNIKSMVISLDNFYIDRIHTQKFDDGNYDFESLQTLDVPYIQSFVDELLTTHKAKMPVFDFILGKRKEYVDVVIDDHTIVIIEGLHALNPALINDHKKEIYKIYLSLNTNYTKRKKMLIPAKDIRLLRRLTRDYYTRGFDAMDILSFWKHVCDGEDKWVKPFKSIADYVVDSVHEYELLLYSRYTKPILKEFLLDKNIKNLLKNQTDENKEVLLLKVSKARYLYDILSNAKSISKEKVPSTSLLWEFVGSAQKEVEPVGKIFNE